MDDLNLQHELEIADELSKEGPDEYHTSKVLNKNLSNSNVIIARNDKFY